MVKIDESRHFELSPNRLPCCLAHFSQPSLKYVEHGPKTGHYISTFFCGWSNDVGSQVPPNCLLKTKSNFPMYKNVSNI